MAVACEIRRSQSAPIAATPKLANEDRFAKHGQQYTTIFHDNLR